MLTLVEQSVGRILAFSKCRKLRPATLAKLSGLSVNALARMESPDWNPSMKTLRMAESVIPPDFTPTHNKDAAE